MKQVIGLPGDSIEYSGIFFINGQGIPNSKILALDFSEFWPSEMRRFIVPEGKIWLVSVYSSQSFDGRYFGMTDRSLIYGIVTPLFVEN